MRSTTRSLPAVLALCVAACLLMSPCRATPSGAAVRTEDEALAILARARERLSALGLHVPREIPLKLRTRDELMVETNGTGGRSVESDAFYRAYGPEEIWLVSGLSAAQTLGVLAHELTHAWQTENAPMQDRRLKEGFARWVQFHVLRDAGFFSMADALARDPDEDYGGGLRALLEVERQRQASGVIELARTAEKI